LRQILQAEQREVTQLSKQPGLPEQGQRWAGNGCERFKALCNVSNNPTQL